MSTISSLRAQVTDANHRPRGMMSIEFDGDAHGPYRVTHDGRTYPGFNSPSSYFLIFTVGQFGISLIFRKSLFWVSGKPFCCAIIYLLFWFFLLLFR